MDYDALTVSLLRLLWCSFGPLPLAVPKQGHCSSVIRHNEVYTQRLPSTASMASIVPSSSQQLESKYNCVVTHLCLIRRQRSHYRTLSLEHPWSALQVLSFIAVWWSDRRTLHRGWYTLMALFHHLNDSGRILYRYSSSESARKPRCSRLH